MNLIYNLFKNEKMFSVKKKNYFEIYQNLFNSYRNKDIVFLEIGLNDGGSINFFKNFFSPNSKIIGFDCNPKSLILERENIKIFKGDQGSEKDWIKFFKIYGKLDIVLDDGGHTNKQQIVTFENVLPNLNDDGLLVIEDTECSYINNFGNPSKYSFVNYAKNCIDTLYRDGSGEREGGGGVESKSHYLTSKHLYSIQFFDSIISFKKNSKKSITYDYIDNRGVHLEEQKKIRNELTLANNYFNFRDSLIKYFPSIVILRKFFNFKFITHLCFKIENYKLRKYFKNFKSRSGS